MSMVSETRMGGGREEQLGSGRLSQTPSQAKHLLPASELSVRNHLEALGYGSVPEDVVRDFVKQLNELGEDDLTTMAQPASGRGSPAASPKHHKSHHQQQQQRHSPRAYSATAQGEQHSGERPFRSQPLHYSPRSAAAASPTHTAGSAHIDAGVVRKQLRELGYDDAHVPQSVIDEFARELQDLYAEETEEDIGNSRLSLLRPSASFQPSAAAPAAKPAAKPAKAARQPYYTDLRDSARGYGHGQYDNDEDEDEEYRRSGVSPQHKSEWQRLKQQTAALEAQQDAYRLHDNEDEEEFEQHQHQHQHQRRQSATATAAAAVEPKRSYFYAQGPPAIYPTGAYAAQQQQRRPQTAISCYTPPPAPPRVRHDPVSRYHALQRQWNGDNFLRRMNGKPPVRAAPNAGGQRAASADAFRFSAPPSRFASRPATASSDRRKAGAIEHMIRDAQEKLSGRPEWQD